MSSKRDQTTGEKEKRPFFARFLLEEELQRVHGGGKVDGEDPWPVPPVAPDRDP